MKFADKQPRDTAKRPETMKSAQQVREFVRTVPPVTSLHVTPQAVLKQAEQQPPNHLLQMTAMLQTTLDVNRLIELFAREVTNIVAHDSVSYHNEPHGIELTLGNPARHSCSYRLIVEGQSLGNIVFTRRRKFPATETAVLEYLLCVLVYPLRNALEFRNATENARKDPLTGVYNRGVMETMMRREVGLAHRHKASLSLMFLDIDNFKNINDTVGHAVGDEIIKAFADCVQRCIRTTDILARYGGDEFVLQLSNTPPEGALLLAERIRKAVDETGLMLVNGHKMRITTSIGVATLSEGDTFETLCARADDALYQAKQNGRNCVRA
ncbi:MAG: GGDEF domain-containing protein [Gammaproteobacteria bacterium]|nr:MAG: GGDEF domain-containing protein [Gammaproteobacteria bacterium]